jgi:hypothetical protein
MFLADARNAAASVFTPAPGWNVAAHTFPTDLAPGASGTIAIRILNVGAAASKGRVTVTDTLPPGVTATQAGSYISLVKDILFTPQPAWDCTGNGPGGAPGVVEATIVTCINDPTNMPQIAGGGGGPDRPNFEPREGDFPYLDPELAIGVSVSSAAKESEVLNNRVAVAGGGASTSASTEEPIVISSVPSAFGFAGSDAFFSNADGTADTQAGSHPYAALFSFDLVVKRAKVNEFPFYEPAGHELRNLTFNLPPGLVGNPNAVPQCTRQLLNAEQCPLSSQVGVLAAENEGTGLGRFSVYNMVPPPGAPAEFAFALEGITTFLDASVRSGSDYGITTHVNNVVQRDVLNSVLILWGNPGDASHNPWRVGLNDKEGCSEAAGRDQDPFHCKPVTPGTTPFLTLPTSCAGPQTFSLSANAWEDASAEARTSVLSHDSNGHATGFTGCEHLGFGPTVTTSPDTSDADTPAGLTVEVRPPIGGLENIEGLGSSDIQNTSVTLPEGLVINPGQAAGLKTCGPGEDGLTTEAEKAEGTEDNGPPKCPNASKVGTVRIKSPLIESAAEKEFEGDVYVMKSNPPELKLLVAASADGVNLKLVGVVHLDEQTGRLTTTFQGTPELPFTVFKLSFSGGAQAALDTPTQCGVYTTTADFMPWSSPFVADFFTNASFGITAGPGGGPCPSSPLPFAPSMVAGSTTDQAGAFTSFSLLLQRGDAQQRIETLQFKEPAGLAGLISSVTLCQEPQAAAGSCPAASHIGHAVVASGPGPYPLVLPQPGAPELPIYLTGPYKGAPFGLSIVTPVIAGPFNLGTIITRAKIEVDPLTAQITVTTDPLPQVVAGVPTDLRQIQSVIDRPSFLFNPTNCSPQEFTGTAWGTPPPGAGGPGATAAVSSHFGVGSCRELAFTPKIGVTTAAKSSKANGASLLFNIAYPKGALGKQSWFNEAKFDLPKQLPARLTTIQKACLARVFETNPAACPPASLIGHAVVHTQVLPVPLSGPVYFVSHGGAKFPDAVIVLQGDGVKINLVGETFINGKTGITSATFRNTPDVPFENIEVTIPSGPFSEFGANLPASAHGSFCGQKLVMPTFFKAQNGLEIKRNTTVGVSGCAKKKALTRKQKLAAALRACKKKAKGKRAGCVRQAQRRYGPVKKKRGKK